ncbi:MAG: hypothetical protein ACRC6M_00125, partial [Microcystaceae cyanobacterium]
AIYHISSFLTMRNSYFISKIMNIWQQELDSITVKRLFIIGIIITLSIFLLKFCVTGFGVFGDGLGYYTSLRSLLFDGNLQVSNEYSYYAQSASNFGGGMRVPGPIPEYSKYTLGLGIVLLPFFALGHILALFLNLFGLDIAPNGMTWPYELTYCLGSVSLGIAGLALSYRVARQYFSRTACAIAVGGIWFASPLTYYLFLEVSMSHAVSAFLIALFLYLTLTKIWLTNRKLQIYLGLIIGLAAWVRPQDVLFLSVPVLIGWLGIEKPNSDSPPFQWSWQRLLDPIYLKAIAVILTAAMIMQLPQLFIYIWQYGGLNKIPYLEEGKAMGYGGSFHWFQPALIQVLFSGHRGLFIWHPITLLSAIGLGFACRPFPRLAGSLLVGFSLQIYFIAAWWCWWQGASVGGRMFANSTLLFVWGLAYFWEYLFTRFSGQLSRRSLRKIALVTTLFLAFWNVLIVFQYQSAMIPPEDPVTLTQLYQNQFRVLPFFLEHLLKKF